MECAVLDLSIRITKNGVVPHKSHHRLRRNRRERDLRWAGIVAPTILSGHAVHWQAWNDATGLPVVSKSNRSHLHCAETPFRPLVSHKSRHWPCRNMRKETGKGRDDWPSRPQRNSKPPYPKPVRTCGPHVPTFTPRVSFILAFQRFSFQLLKSSLSQAFKLMIGQLENGLSTQNCRLTLTVGENNRSCGRVPHPAPPSAANRVLFLPNR
jgi:hypothetical protein